MRKSTKFLGTLAVAGLVAAGGSAFTFGNTLPASVAGYASAAVSGVTVTNVAYVVDPADASLLTDINFVVTEDVSAGYDAILTINGPAGGATQIVCDADTASAIDCPVTDPIASINSITLTVTEN
jgi:hypothetical protein